MIGPKSDVGKILAMAVILAVVLAGMAFSRATKKIRWPSDLPAAPVEKEVTAKGLKEQVLRLREEALKGEAPRLAEEGVASEASPDEKIGGPEAAAEELTPEFREEIRRIVEEARTEVEKFNSMTPEFKRVEKLDRELLFKLMDEKHFPRAAHDLKSEADVFHHVFSFIRSHTDAELLKMAREGGELEYYQMMGNPEAHRGRVVDFAGRFVRVYQLLEWRSGETAHVPNTSGVRTTALCYFVGSAKRRQIHILLTMTDPRKYRSDDLVRCTAVFVKRWAGQMPSGDWVYFPLLVAREFRAMPKPRDVGTETVALGIAAFAIIGVVVLYLAARYEFSHSAEARAHLKDRLRRGRGERIKKAKEAGGSMPWDKEKKGPPEAGERAEKDAPSGEDRPGAGSEERKDEGGEDRPAPRGAD